MLNAQDVCRLWLPACRAALLGPKAGVSALLKLRDGNVLQGNGLRGERSKQQTRDFPKIYRIQFYALNIQD